MKKIIFVCHGNICRSPMAEYILKNYASKANLTLDICSRAISSEEIGNDIYYATKEILDKYQIPYQIHRACKLTQEEIDNSDYLIVMDNHNLDNLKRQYNIKDKRIYKILEFCGKDDDIIDPWYSRNFEITYHQIDAACQKIIEEIKGEKFK